MSHASLASLYFDGVRLYRSGGMPKGDASGWGALAELYSVAQGQWTVITGTPGSGKSEWVDALLVNLAERDPRWFFALYSPENFPLVTHLVKLVEKRMRKPFAEGVTPRMSEAEFRRGAEWVLERFVWLETALKTPDELLGAAMSYGQERKLGVVLDPWNTLEHQRGSMSETDYVSFVLTGVTRLVREKNAHVWLIVHPAKLPRNKDGTRPVPTPYDISGSAHWYNKADNILTVHRDQLEGGQEVEIHVQKVRFKHVGHPGLAVLRYDKVTGRYFDAPAHPIDGESYADPQRGQVPPEIDEERAAIQAAG